MQFQIEMFDEYLGTVQAVSINREEFILLKWRLAELRGFAVPKVELEQPEAA